MLPQYNAKVPFRYPEMDSNIYIKQFTLSARILDRLAILPTHSHQCVKTTKE